MTNVSVQESYFLRSLGDDWFDRNYNDLGKVDLIQEALDKLGHEPTSVLEIGCSNGWRLKKFRDRGIAVNGIDPSRKAICAGHSMFGDKDTLQVGVASSLPYLDNRFDTVILGFCMCLCDPNDWPMVIAECNRVLVNGGILLIHDYHQDDDQVRIGIWPYQHTPLVPWYFMDWKRLWLSNPFYKGILEVAKGENRMERVVVLQKAIPKIDLKTDARED
jgi:SAM-dependent methyltransferase